jgi:hypothetical protein
LIECPQYLIGLADDPADSIVQNRFCIGKMMQDEPDWPLVRSITPGQLVIAQGKAFERLLSLFQAE